MTTDFLLCFDITQVTVNPFLLPLKNKLLSSCFISDLKNNFLSFCYRWKSWNGIKYKKSWQFFIKRNIIWVFKKKHFLSKFQRCNFFFNLDMYLDVTEWCTRSVISVLVHVKNSVWTSASTNMSGCPVWKSLSPRTAAMGSEHQTPYLMVNIPHPLWNPSSVKKKIV